MSVITVPGRHDVRSYGAAGDGMTDDREAVQAACDAAESEGGGLVLLPAGAYKVGACGAQPWCLRVGAGVWLVGDGDGATTIVQAVGVPKWVRVVTLKPGAAGWGVRGLGIDGQRAQQTPHEHRAGIFVMDATDGQIEGVTVRGMTGDGIQLHSGVSRIRLRDCALLDCDRDGVSFTGSAADLWLDACRFAGIAGQPIDAEPESGCVERVSITGCHVGLAGSYGIAAAGRADAFNTGWRVTGNVIEGGVHAIYQRDLLLANNVIRGGGGRSPVTLVGASDGARIAGNQIDSDEAAGDGAIYAARTGLGAPSALQITDNRIVYRAGSGIRLWGAGSAQVSGNRLDAAGAGRDGIYCYATGPVSDLAVLGNVVAAGVGAAIGGIVLQQYAAHVTAQAVVAQNTIRSADRGIRVLGTAPGFPQLVLAGNAISPTVAIPLDLSAGIMPVAG